MRYVVEFRICNREVAGSLLWFGADSLRRGAISSVCTFTFCTDFFTSQNLSFFTESVLQIFRFVDVVELGSLNIYLTSGSVFTGKERIFEVTDVIMPRP